MVRGHVAHDAEQAAFGVMLAEISPVNCVPSLRRKRRSVRSVRRWFSSAMPERLALQVTGREHVGHAHLQQLGLGVAGQLARALVHVAVAAVGIGDEDRVARALEDLLEARGRGR